VYRAVSFFIKERKKKKIITRALLLLIVIWRGSEVELVCYAAEEKKERKCVYLEK